MRTRFKDPLAWIYGLFSGFIGGGAASVVNAFTVMGIAPDKFDLSANLQNTLKVAGVSFLISGALNAFLYLKQSPLPPLEKPNEN